MGYVLRPGTIVTIVVVLLLSICAMGLGEALMFAGKRSARAPADVVWLFPTILLSAIAVLVFGLAVARRGRREWRHREALASKTPWGLHGYRSCEGETRYQALDSSLPRP